MSDERILLALDALARARQATFDEESQLVYVRVLGKGDPDLVISACEEYAAEPRDEFSSAMPSAGELLQRARQIGFRRALAPGRKMLAMRAGEETFRCAQCHDDPDGWLFLDCPKDQCDRTKPHPPHPFVVRCPCWLRRNGEGLSFVAQERRGKGKPVSADFLAYEDLTSGQYRWQDARTSR